jgi:hypothetical protein
LFLAGTQAESAASEALSARRLLDWEALAVAFPPALCQLLAPLLLIVPARQLLLRQYWCFYTGKASKLSRAFCDSMGTFVLVKQVN